jgi:probable rRNA maturation factor
MTYHIDIQHACSTDIPIADTLIMLWAQTTLQSAQPAAELTIRLVDAEEMITLNNTYRKQNKTTNVLAFPSNIPSAVALDCPLLGDVVICPQVLLEESIADQKPLEAHWAHIVIHGILHLLGHDHIKPEEAHLMEQQEISLLAQLGYDNPYQEEPHLD